jgi:hypothetical protein
LALAHLCQRYKKRYAAAACFYADAFAAGATQSSQRAYNASCAAALAAAGKGLLLWPSCLRPNAPPGNSCVEQRAASAEAVEK